jgi:Helix-turn-helix domain
LPTTRPEALPAPLLVPLREAFRMLSISLATGYRLVYSGDLPIKKLGRRTYVVTADLEAYVASLPTEVGPNKMLAAAMRAARVRRGGRFWREAEVEGKEAKEG